MTCKVFFFEKNVELVISKNRWTWKRDVFSLYKTISWEKVSLWMSNFFPGHPQCNLDLQTVIKFIPTLMLRRNIFTGLFQRQTLLDSRVRCLVWVCASKYFLTFNVILHKQKKLLQNVFIALRFDQLFRSVDDQENKSNR